MLRVAERLANDGTFTRAANAAKIAARYAEKHDSARARDIADYAWDLEKSMKKMAQSMRNIFEGKPY